MRNIHIIPTDKPSRLGYLTKKGKQVFNDLRLFDRVMPNILDSENQHLYITNSEEIKQGDWIFNEEREPSVLQCIGKGSLRGWNKIILTTDQSLIQYGIEAIDDEFLEWFVKNPSCDEVETYSLGIKNEETGESCHYEYEIIIPKEEQCTCKEHNPYCCQIHGNCPTCVKKEEPKQLNSEDFGLPKFGTKEYNDLASGLFGGKPKQETVEDAAENNWDKINSQYKNGLNPYAHKIGFIEGSEWMQERMYSEEEVNDLLEVLKRSISEINHLKYTYKDKGHCGKYLSDCETIIEQFKKK